MNTELLFVLVLTVNILYLIILSEKQDYLI